jgi:hypothetical protein
MAKLTQENADALKRDRAARQVKIIAAKRKNETELSEPSTIHNEYPEKYVPST